MLLGETLHRSQGGAISFRELSMAGRRGGRSVGATVFQAPRGRRCGRHRLRWRHCHLCSSLSQRDRLLSQTCSGVRLPGCRRQGSPGSTPVPSRHPRPELHLLSPWPQGLLGRLCLSPFPPEPSWGCSWRGDSGCPPWLPRQAAWSAGPPGSVWGLGGARGSSPTLAPGRQGSKEVLCGRISLGSALHTPVNPASVRRLAVVSRKSWSRAVGLEGWVC